MLLAVSIGDPNGIGPEVALRAALDPTVRAVGTAVLVGPVATLQHHADRLQQRVDLVPVRSWDEARAAAPSPGRAIVIEAGLDAIADRPGTVAAEAGALSMRSVAAACDACLAGAADAMVTAPISKEAIALGGYDFPGHTEFLAERTGASPLMILATERLPAFFGSGPLRVALVTAHVPLAAAPALVTEAAVLAKIGLLARALQGDFGCRRPRIAVLGLNPHAGDGGVLGREDLDRIRPAIEAARSVGLDVEGPIPADGFFGRQRYRQVDGVLAMTHDQGLAPFKALATGAGVNVTAGLPIVRTSPDHGTAFDLAGQGAADPASMAEALRIAARIAARRTVKRVDETTSR